VDLHFLDQHKILDFLYPLKKSLYPALSDEPFSQTAKANYDLLSVIYLVHFIDYYGKLPEQKWKMYHIECYLVCSCIDDSMVIFVVWLCTTLRQLLSRTRL
jgi:hypothetical protein